MRPDLICKIRRQQMDISVELAKQLSCEFSPYVANGKLSALEGYVEGYHLKNLPDDNYDRIALTAMVRGDLQISVYHSIIGYTDWVAGRMVRSGDYSVPTPAEINFATIEQKYFAPREALRRTVSLMHSKRNLPLLGKIKDGKFNPDPDEFQRWKEVYDWSGSPSK